MSRNNEDRLTPQTGANQDSSAEVPPPATTGASSTTNDSPFDFVVPTEFVELPSGGDFYPEGHALYGVDTIEIRHMTAKDEDILTSRTLLRKGVALDRMIKNLMVDKRLNIEDMLVGDKNAIIVAARKSGYGDEYATKVNCPSCGTTNHSTFDLAEVTTTDANFYETLPAVERNGNNFVITLPKTNAEVTVRLLTGRDEQQQTRQTRMAKKAGMNGEEPGLTTQFKRFVVSVNGNSSPRDIAYFIDHMPAMDSRFLRTVYKSVTPNVDMTQFFECDTCGYATEMEVPFTADFFWPE